MSEQFGLSNNVVTSSDFLHRQGYFTLVIRPDKCWHELWYDAGYDRNIFRLIKVDQFLQIFLLAAAPAQNYNDIFLLCVCIAACMDSWESIWKHVVRYSASHLPILSPRRCLGFLASCWRDHKANDHLVNRSKGLCSEQEDLLRTLTATCDSGSGKNGNKVADAQLGAFVGIDHRCRNRCNPNSKRSRNLSCCRDVTCKM